MDFPEDFGSHRVYVDAGHGAAGNSGNESAFCVEEQAFTLSVAQDLATRLATTGHFDVRTSRRPGAVVDYKARIAEAGAWAAEIFLSLHSDTRGMATASTIVGGRTCWQNEGHEGFSVLWSDEGTLSGARETLATALAARMAGAGFSAYLGADYVGIYEMGAPGVFVDRHVDTQRIMVLRRPVMPSVIIETHHAWDAPETTRWDLPETRASFAEAVGAALIDVLR